MPLALTLIEAIEYIEDELTDIGHVEVMPSKPRITARINRTQRETGRNLRVPTLFYKDQATGAPFTLPPNALETGLLKVKTQNTDVRYPKVPILSIHEANEKYPDWEQNEIEGYDTFRTRLIIYDPKNKDEPCYPIGFDDGELIRLQYVAKIDDLTADDDYIWGGHLEDYHDIIVKKVLANLLKGKTDWYQTYMSEAMELEEQLFNYIQDVDNNDSK